MFTTKDLKELEKRGITEVEIKDQLQSFAVGFPFLKIADAAAVGRGIERASAEEIDSYHRAWSDYLRSEAKILKFVPASGAASRMFKELFEFLEKDENETISPALQLFFDKIDSFAFYEALNSCCLQNENQSINELMQAKQSKKIIENLLLAKGLNYGALPKALLLFHSYSEELRTAMQEHFVEGALYASNKAKQTNIHFTVSKEHRELFEKHLEDFLKTYEEKYEVQYSVGFSEQKASTDTLAADANNQPFRDENDELVFRPGGHGALIENLNDLDADIIFIKNIDNVVPDSLKEPTVEYKKLIAGLLVYLQAKSFAYLRELEDEEISIDLLEEIAAFCEKELYILNTQFDTLSKDEKRLYLFGKLNRPMRVCGMVKNEGEPGGGPFLIENKDGSVALQILESSQIDMSNSLDKEKMLQATHFNPVDLVCATKNYLDEKFDLVKYIDKEAGFISLKSKSGKELKALELPGLWNGAMSDWNTVFVEVPVATFNPVKTVNDLLRPEHQ